MERLAQDDLTGAALVALMRLSFAEQGLAPHAPRKPGGPHASLAGKAALAEAMLEAHGPAPLLRVGEALPRLGFDPIAAALLAARDGPDALARWTRLQRYVHTRHPLRILESAADRARLEHRGAPGDPPSPAVDLILAGVIASLLAQVGGAGLTLAIGGRPAIARGRVVMAALDPGLDTGAWSYAWTPAPKPPAPGADDGRRGLAARARDLIAADLLKPWRLADLAAALGRSTRTLQRRLAEDGSSLRGLRREAQIRKASALLLAPGASVSAVGYACGFADAAHFARAFAQAVGMPPAAYRGAAPAPRGRIAAGADPGRRTSPGRR